MAHVSVYQLILLVGSLLVQATPVKERFVDIMAANKTGDAGVLRSLITVYAFPENGASLYIKLYSGDDTRSGTFTTLGSVEYSFTAGISTKFWVDARWTSQGGSVKSFTKVPVFGDGRPKKSGTWWVDNVGIKRTKEDNNDCPPCDTFTRYW